MAKTMVKPADIKAAASSLINMALNFGRAVPIDTEAGEKQAVAVAYESEGQIMVCIAILDEQDKIVRTEKAQPLDQIVDTLISKI